MQDVTKRLVVGVLAHVDSGKTTLSEAMLYRAGAIRRLGRVDHRDAFLDTDSLERARGITIFAKQALFQLEGTQIAWLDTPGHVDFSAEAERTVQVLDYAVLVISGPDGVQSHTETLWALLRRSHVPTFLFVNKMDLPGPGREAILDQLRRRLGEGFVDFGADAAAREGLRIYNASAYRSYTTQKWVYQRYVNQEGTQEADTYSARPGCSEHQTGLALDINTASLSDHFEETEEYAWLVENSWRYGFILRFPEGKEEITGYQFEPWHYRYVGPAAARVCYENGWTLEEYHARQPAPDR